MIVTRTPLRISLGGGGTDLPSYYRKHGGFVISAAINKYIYINVNKHFFPGYLLKYSETELTDSIAEIKHRIIREALTMLHIDEPLEITSMADVPGGTGLGSSGTFSVGLVHALLAHTRRLADAELLAQTAVEIEMNRLKDPVGKQDQYIAAYGGILIQEYHQDDTVTVASAKMTEQSLFELRDSLMLFFVGTTRSASSILQDQKTRSEQDDEAMMRSLHHAKEIGYQTLKVLESGEISNFGELMHEHWLKKRERSKGMSNGRIDELYDLALSKGGASGGKLVGAGGSGFLMFQTPDRRRLRRTLLEQGLSEVDFSFDFDGSMVLLRNRG